jgi:hypothetical protein
MYYSVSVFIMVWQCISPEVNVKSFKKSCIPSAMDGTGGMLWGGSEEDGNVRNVWRRWRHCEHGESDTLLKVDRICHTVY